MKRGDVETTQVALAAIEAKLPFLHKYMYIHILTCTMYMYSICNLNAFGLLVEIRKYDVHTLYIHVHMHVCVFDNVYMHMHGHSKHATSSKMYVHVHVHVGCTCTCTYITVLAFWVSCVAGISVMKMMVCQR